MSTSELSYWRKCNACKKEIGFGTTYYACSVSTCNRPRTGLVFCAVTCWDSHLGEARHRDAWATDARSPSREQWQKELAADPAAGGLPPAKKLATPDSVTSQPQSRPVVAAAPAVQTRTAAAPTPAPVRRVVGDASPVTAAAVEGVQLAEVTDKDVLIVVSKVKKYIKDRSGMNCSDAVADMLSDHIRVLCDDAIRAAGRDERKTVLDRDIPRARR
jgi:hypothetical protein